MPEPPTHFAALTRRLRRANGEAHSRATEKHPIERFRTRHPAVLAAIFTGLFALTSAIISTYLPSRVRLDELRLAATMTAESYRAPVVQGTPTITLGTQQAPSTAIPSGAASQPSMVPSLSPQPTLRPTNKVSPPTATSTATPAPSPTGLSIETKLVLAGPQHNTVTPRLHRNQHGHARPGRPFHQQPTRPRRPQAPRPRHPRRTRPRRRRPSHPSRRQKPPADPSQPAPVRPPRKALPESPCRPQGSPSYTYPNGFLTMHHHHIEPYLTSGCRAIESEHLMQIECTAILFDLDGVLIDSTASTTRHWQQWAQRHNLDLSEIMKVAHGRRTIETMRLVAPQTSGRTKMSASRC